MSNIAYIKIQCIDKSGKVGDFACDYDTGHRVSPICDDMAQLSSWLKKYNYAKQPYHNEHPCGVYVKGQQL